MVNVLEKEDDIDAEPVIKKQEQIKLNRKQDRILIREDLRNENIINSKREHVLNKLKYFLNKLMLYVNL